LVSLAFPRVLPDRLYWSSKPLSARFTGRWTIRRQSETVQQVSRLRKKLLAFQIHDASLPPLLGLPAWDAMSGRTRKRAIIGAVLVLVCVLVALVVRRRPSGLALSLIGLETNNGVISASVLVSNAGPRAFDLVLASESKPGPKTGWGEVRRLNGAMMVTGIRAYPEAAQARRVPLPEGGHRRVIVIATRVYTDGLLDRVRLYFEQHVHRRQDTYTLEIPE